MINPIAGLEAEFGIKAVVCPEGLLPQPISVSADAVSVFSVVNPIHLSVGHELKDA